MSLRCFSILAPPSQGQMQYQALLKQLHIDYYLDYHLNPNANRQQFVAQYYSKVGEKTASGMTLSVYKLR